MNPEHLAQKNMAVQAASWLEDLDSADYKGRAAFLRWLKASPLHVHEFLLAARVREALRRVDPIRRMDAEALAGRARDGSNVRSIETVIGPFARRRQAQRGTRWIAALAASLAAAALLTWIGQFHLNDGHHYATKRGEQRMVKLDDGSVVFLNTQTRVQVRYRKAARDIYLSEGQALFQVQHDTARPFRVHGASALIQAVGTQFDVQIDVGRTIVAVIEGAVQVSTKAETSRRRVTPVNPTHGAAKIKAGEAATVDITGNVKLVNGLDTKAVTAWRQQRLIFHGTPLTEIADEFNRYNDSPRLRVEGVALGARRFDGSFNALRPESFLTYLSQEQGLDFERRESEVVIRERARDLPRD